VGIILDLGKETEVGKAQLLLPAPGCSFEIRYNNDGSASIDHWGTAATLNSSPNSAPLVFQPVTARYWMVWITRLTIGVPGAGEGYACAISEADLFAP
jgi:hypothetical protein